MELPEHIGNYSQLYKMKLDHNCLRKLPKGFSDLTNLEILTISHNKFNGIENETSGLLKLRHFDA